MVKARRKWIAILATLALLATLLVPMVGPASAASTYSMDYVQKVKAGYAGGIGTLVITMDPVSAESSVVGSTYKYVVLSLPSSPSGYVLFPKVDNNGKVIGLLSESEIEGRITGTNYFGTGASFKVERISNTEIKLYVTNLATPTDVNADSRIRIPLVIAVPTGVTGDVTLTASAPSTSTFSSGSIVVARVGVSGKVTLAVESVPSISSSGGAIGVVDIKEDVAGSLVNSGGTEALKFRLPPGFKWATVKRDPTTGNITGVSELTSSVRLSDLGSDCRVVWGNLNLSGVTLEVTNDGRDLKILNPETNASTSGTFLKLQLGVVVDESVAKTSEVKVTVSGATTASPSELVVANYGEYGVTVKAYSKTDIVAGKVAQDIGKLEIDEAIPGSLLEGRTITLTLPQNVRWSQAPNIDTELSQNYGNITFTPQLVGSDGRMLKLTFSGSTGGNTEPAKIVLKDMQVTPAADFSGDLKVDVGGSQGVSGTVVLATVKASVSMTASSTPQVIIGKSDQTVGDITITEAMADAIRGTVTGWDKDTNGYITSVTPTGAPQAKLVIEAPPGVTFIGTPKVEVTQGDLQIDASAVSTDKTAALEGQIIIPIKSGSTTPSTIKISGIKVAVDRTVPEGDLVFKVKNTAVDETVKKWDATKGEFTDEALFEGHTTVASAVVAKCVTPAPSEQKATAVFKVGEAKYTLNGVEQTMDVAPYVKNGRTYVPVRYVAQALGVAPENIYYADGVVTLLKGDRVVQLTIGSNVLRINGTDITMDVTTELTNGRTMLPFRWVAQALGASVQWDEATQTVTMNL